MDSRGKGRGRVRRVVVLEWIGEESEERWSGEEEMVIDRKTITHCFTAQIDLFYRGEIHVGILILISDLFRA